VLSHQRDNPLDPEDRADQVHGERSLDLVPPEALKAAQLIEPGVVDEHVDAPEGLTRLRHSRIPGPLVRHVHGNGNGKSLAVDASGDCRNRLAIDVGEDHPRTQSGAEAGMRGALATRRTSDEQDLVVQLYQWFRHGHTLHGRAEVTAN
jgi:hypothetical protein